MKNFRVKKLKKEFCCTNGHVRYAGVHLASDPYHTANFNLFPKVHPVRKLRSLTSCAEYGLRLPSPSASNGNNHRLKSVSFSNGVQKILPDFKYKNLKIRSRHCNPRIHFTDRQLPNYLKRSIEK